MTSIRKSVILYVAFLAEALAAPWLRLLLCAFWTAGRSEARRTAANRLTRQASSGSLRPAERQPRQFGPSLAAWRFLQNLPRRQSSFILRWHDRFALLDHAAVAPGPHCSSPRA